jgi:hypothetical protein
MSLFLRCAITLMFLLHASLAPASDPLLFSLATIQVGERATEVERKVAQLLADRLAEPSGLPVRVVSESEAPESTSNELTILLGIPEHHAAIAQVIDRERIEPLGELAPGPEGFLLQVLDREKDRPALLLAASVDERGALYAVGEILRQVDITLDGFEVPGDLSVRTAPAFEVRGTQYGQSHIAKLKGKVRDWTEEELHRMILDYALAGANVFSTGFRKEFDFLKSYGLMTQGGFGANTGDGPPEWEAKESIGRTGYLCLSVPEAVEAQIERCENEFKNGPAFDFVKFHGGDGGGCECERCNPYGLTFIKVVEKMAERIHKYHPETRVYFTNQKFDDEDDLAIFKYLQEEPREWLWAWGYGPGSDAMSWQPGHRQTHRMDLFRYPGFGPFGRYCQEIVHQLPPQQVLVYYNEITHWRYAQHGYIQMYPRADRNGDLPPHWNHFIYERRPDQALTMVYDRLTFYAWPKFYHWLFNQLLPHSVGDITHSSGHHDHFNQWMWQRLLWAPHTSVEEVVDDYSRTWFGEEAAPLMAKALFQLEENLEEDRDRPIDQKPGIGRYYNLVKQAGALMPAHEMKTNWLWREYMVKGALDKYVQLAVAQQTAVREKVETHIGEALETDAGDRAIESALEMLSQTAETKEMALLREEAERLGEESNELYGVRNEGIFNLVHDYIGLGWYDRQLRRALESEGERRRELLWMVAHYEDAGEGGYYDNCGTFDPSPNLVKGYPYDHGQPFVPEMLSESNLPSQKSMCFTQDEDQGVTFHYRGLDPQADYRIRFTFVRPWYQERYAMRMNQKSQTIYADDIPLATEVELPERESEFFTFGIPKQAVADGELVLRFERAPGVTDGPQVLREMWRNSGGWGTIVSEAWLMREDSLPWK